MIIDSGLVTGSLQVTGNTIISGSIEVTQGITGSFKGNAETATSASFASTATTASYALTASYLEGYVSPFPFTGDAEITGSLTVTDSISSTQGFIGSLQGNADTATSASYAAQSSNATSASFAQTASNVDTLYQDVELHGNLTVYGTSSFNYVTSSQLDVQQSFISVNVFEPAERFGGIKVYDSGSSDATASLAWDSLHNHWIYQNVSGSTYSGGMFLAGPRNTGSLGDEPNLARWMVARSDGGDHLENTQIFSSGSVTQVTGSLLVTQGVTASLSGTASYALTASYLEGYVSPFPFTGSATITGSLEVDGPTTATSFVKQGGTSSEYLMADGSTTEGGTGGASIRVEENFVATAGQTVFPITYEIGQIDVYYNGLKLYPDEFTANNGTSVVLQEAAVLNSQVSIVKYVSATTSTAVRNEVVFVATANQNTFSVNYTVGQVDVFHNGAKLNPEEFTATNGTSVVLGFDCLEGASVTMLVYLSAVSGASGTANYVTKFTGAATMEDSQIYDNGTNIGIAKASPNAKLDVNGNTIVTGSLNVTQGITGSLQGTASNAVSASFATTASFTNVAGLGGFIQGGNSFGSQATLGTNDNQSLALETSGSTRMFISSNGNVGIGTTSPESGWNLDVPGIVTLGGSAGNGRLYFSSEGTTNGAAYIQSRNLTVATPLHFFSSTNYFQGIIGIGVTSPSQKLTIGDGTGTGNQYIRLHSSATDMYIGQTGSNLFGAGNGQVIVTDVTYTSNLAIGTLNSSANIVFGTNSTERISILASGAIAFTGTSTGLAAAGFENSNSALAFYATQGGGTTKDIFFQSGGSLGSPRFTIKASGDVGINTTTPSSKLEVASGNITLTDGYKIGWRYAPSDSSMYDYISNSYDGASEGSGINYRGGSWTGGDIIAHSFYSYWGGAWVERISIRNSGTVSFNHGGGFRTAIQGNNQINTTYNGGGTAMYLNFQGNGAIYAGSSYAVLYAGSDRRIKSDIEDATPTLEKVLNLTPRTFKYKERPDFTNYGFIAQEVEEVMPEIVKTSQGISNCNGEEIVDQKSIESYGLAWASILVKAIQEQQEQIQQLRAEIEILKNK